MSSYNEPFSSARPPRIASASYTHISSQKVFLPVRNFSTSHLLKYHAHGDIISKREYSKACNTGCPCPFPCGPCGCKSGCGCLPPPCNTPPRCLQYMTGYYYYPYGTWFCGPYHVAGTCAPVGGKCSCPCPKCCAACVCTAPYTEYAENKRKNDNPFPAESPCQSLTDPPQSRTGLSKLFNLNPNKTENELKTKRTMPPIMTSMIYPYQNTSSQSKNTSPQSNVAVKAQRIYPVLYNKNKSNSYHTRAKLQTPDLSPIYNRSQQMKSIYDQKRYEMTNSLQEDRTISEKKKRNSLHKHDLLKYSRFVKRERKNRRPHVSEDFEPFEI